MTNFSSTKKHHTVLHTFPTIKWPWNSCLPLLNYSKPNKKVGVMCVCICVCINMCLHTCVNMHHTIYLYVLSCSRMAREMESWDARNTNAWKWLSCPQARGRCLVRSTYNHYYWYIIIMVIKPQEHKRIKYSDDLCLKWENATTVSFQFSCRWNGIMETVTITC